MRKVFLLSLLLVVLSLVIPWLVVTLSPAEEPAAQPLPSVTASAAVAPDSETAITALSGGALVETTMADWLPGVVAAEMPASFAPEALRAQAVAARTYILQRVRGGAANHPEAGRLRPIHLLLRAQGRRRAARTVGCRLRAQHGAHPPGRDRHGRAVPHLRRAAHPRGVPRLVRRGDREQRRALERRRAVSRERVLPRDGAGRAELRLDGRDRGRRRAHGRTRPLSGLRARRRPGHMVRHAGAR